MSDGSDGSDWRPRVPGQKRGFRESKHQQPPVLESRNVRSKMPISQSSLRLRPLASTPDALTAAATLVGFARASAQPELPPLPVLRSLCNMTSREGNPRPNGADPLSRPDTVTSTDQRAAQSRRSRPPPQNSQREQRSGWQSPVMGRSHTRAHTVASSAAGASADSFDETQVSAAAS